MRERLHFAAPWVTLTLALLGTCGCGGLVDADASPPQVIDPAAAPGSGGFGMGDCPPSQWDCTGVPVSCDYVSDETGQARPTISLGGACRCDFSRPIGPADCADGELFVCGSLSFDVRVEETLAFDPVSCRCAVNAGYYCNHCMSTGLYTSVSGAEGCGLAGVSDKAAVFCGCGP